MGGVRDEIMGSLRREPSSSSSLPHGHPSIQRTAIPSGQGWSAKDNASPAQTASVTDKELEATKRQSRRTLRSRLRSRWCIATLIVAMLLVIALIVSLVLTVGRKNGGGGAATPIGPSRTGTIVTLADGQYQGVSQPDGVTNWLGMRYAAAPVGDLRFAAPQNPPKFSGVHLANEVSDLGNAGFQGEETNHLYSTGLDVLGSVLQ